jgi:hypothetical protein
MQKSLGTNRDAHWVCFVNLHQYSDYTLEYRGPEWYELSYCNARVNLKLFPSPNKSLHKKRSHAFSFTWQKRCAAPWYSAMLRRIINAKAYCVLLGRSWMAPMGCFREANHNLGCSLVSYGFWNEKAKCKINKSNIGIGSEQNTLLCSDHETVLTIHLPYLLIIVNFLQVTLDSLCHAISPCPKYPLPKN